MRMAGITDVGADAAHESSTRQSGGSDDYESEYERFDVTGLAFGKQHPTTAVRGEATVLRYFPDWDNDEPDRGYFGIVIEDPSVVTDDEALDGTVVFESTEDTGDDFKVVNTDDGETKVIEGSGVDFAGNLFYGEQVDDLDTDTLVLKATGSSGRSIASTLDVKGAGNAHSVGAFNDEDIELHDGGFPQHSGHLVEYHPDGRDGERPRIARDTELRPDVEGRDIVVMIQRLRDIQEDYDGPAYWATVFADVEDDRQDELAEYYAGRYNSTHDDEREADDFIHEVDGEEMVRLQPTDEFEPDADLLRDTGYIQWNRVDDDVMNEARVEAGFDPYDPEN